MQTTGHLISVSVPPTIKSMSAVRFMQLVFSCACLVLLHLWKNNKPNRSILILSLCECLTVKAGPINVSNEDDNLSRMDTASLWQHRCLKKKKLKQSLGLSYTIKDTQKCHEHAECCFTQPNTPT